MARISVQIEWPEGLRELPERARGWITIQDTTMADAPAVVIAETTIDNLSPDRPVTAEIEVGEVDLRADLTVRVHVARSGQRTGTVGVGDLISTQSHPVLTQGHGNFVVVPLRVVGS